VDAIRKLVAEHTELSKEVGKFKQDAVNASLKALKNKAETIGEINFISETLPIADADMLRDAAFRIRNEVDNLFLVLGSSVDQKALLVIMISDNLVSEKDLNAGVIIREIAREIKGGGGGQPFFATAGGKDPGGISAAMDKARKMVRELQ